MAGINPISGLGSINPLQPSMPTAAPGAAEGAKGNFGDVFKTYMEHVDGQQQNSQTAIQDMLTGKSPDVLPVVSAMAEADMSFKLLIGVRNKVIDAYKQTMNMQI